MKKATRRQLFLVVMTRGKLSQVVETNATIDFCYRLPNLLAMEIGMCCSLFNGLLLTNPVLQIHKH